MGAAFSNAVTGTMDLVTGTGAGSAPPRELIPVEAEIRIHTLWKDDVGAGDEGRWLDLTVAGSEDGMVYAADCKGRITALKLRDGSEVFEVETGLPVSAGPGLGRETLLLGTSDAQVVSLDL